MPDALTKVARDLAVLAASDRRAIYQALDRSDRDRLAAAMRGGARAIAGSTDRGGKARHSPWLGGLIAAAQAGEGAMTAAAGAALLDAAGTSRGSSPQANGRSLLQAAGGLLGQGRER